MNGKLPSADRRWSPDARDLWRAVHAEFELSTHHRVLLKQACELLSRAEQARQHIAEDGLVLTNQAGTQRVNPMISEERNSINAARLVLREIGLDFEGKRAPDESSRGPRVLGYA